MITISIITINFNNANGLRKTISSVLLQQYPNIQYIIIDGGSDDGSADIIKEYRNDIDYYVSEPDNGIYHAMNKGIAQIKGDFCLFLNSGDYLTTSLTITEAAKLIEQEQFAYDIFYGDIFYGKTLVKSAKFIDLNFLANTSLPHPCTFFATNLFKSNNLGLYLTDYKIISDWLFFLKAYLAQKKFKYIDLTISVFEHNGISSNSELIATEKEKALAKHYPNLIADFRSLEILKIYKYSRLHQVINKIREWLK